MQVDTPERRLWPRGGTVTSAEGHFGEPLGVCAVNGYRVARLGETTSTNTVVADAARKGAAEGLVVTAEYQSAGRGRFDRRWEAPPGAGLLFSVLLRPGRPVLGVHRAGTLAPERRHLVVAAVSLAVARAALVVADVRLWLKWPNDLLAPDGRKVAGVLAEVVQGPEAAGLEAAGLEAAWAVVVGVGLNVSWAPEGASCLEALAGRPVDKDRLLEEVLRALGELYGRWDEVAKRYRESLGTLGKQVVVHLAHGDSFEAPKEARGQAVGVDDDGRLLVSTANGVVEVAAGDVEHASIGSLTGL